LARNDLLGPLTLGPEPDGPLRVGLRVTGLCPGARGRRELEPGRPVIWPPAMSPKVTALVGPSQGSRGSGPRRRRTRPPRLFVAKALSYFCKRTGREIGARARGLTPAGRMEKLRTRSWKTPPSHPPCGLVASTGPDKCRQISGPSGRRPVGAGRPVSVARSTVGASVSRASRSRIPT
jgi:hypothetical protein